MKSNVNTNFKKDCKVINLAYEYPGYTGKEKYAIITDLSEEDLESLYGDKIMRYRPFVILSREMGSVMTEYENNEKKHEMRSKINELSCDWSNDRDALISALSEPDEQTELEEMINEKAFDKAIWRAFATLTELQRKYLIWHYVYKSTFREIAEAESKTAMTICDICHAARQQFIKAFVIEEVDS